MQIVRSTLIRKAKDIYIPVHNTVELSYMATLFMGSKYFQRLSKLKQLGACNYVYPGAVHTRFEHSVGVYFLAGKLLDRLRITPESQLHSYLSKVPELQTYYKTYASNNMDVVKSEADGPGLSKWIMELVKIAGLMHDIGHGPYSHVFDDDFIRESKYASHPMATHEARSCLIVQTIVSESSVLSKFMTLDDVRFIQQLIHPDDDREGFIYQIVSNSFNGLDVDKYDYIVRDTHHVGLKTSFEHTRLISNVIVVDDRIVYPEQAKQDIFNMFLTRHSMFLNVYSHKGVISAQYIITEIMKLVDRTISITDSITDFNKFCKMTDEYVIQCAEFIILNRADYIKRKIYTDAELIELQALLDRLNTHNLYPHIGTTLSSQPNTDHISPILNRFRDTSKYMIYSKKVGYVSGDNANPLSKIYVYRTKDTLFSDSYAIKAKLINKHDITNLVPDRYQEYITMVFRRDRDTDGLAADKKDFDELMDEVSCTSSDVDSSHS